MGSRFEQDKSWADDHINEINRVVRKVVGRIVSITPSDETRDRRDGIDYEITVPSGDIACRIRRADRYKQRDLTMTTFRPSGVVPEVDKIRRGSPRWYLYAWAIDGRFVEWMFVDLKIVMAKGLIEHALRRGQVTNKDKSRFLSVSLEDLQEAGAIVAAEVRGPDTSRSLPPRPELKGSLPRVQRALIQT